MWEALATRHLQLARETGVLTELPFALNALSAAYTFGGEPAKAASLIDEAQAVNEAIGSHSRPMVRCCAPPGGAEKRKQRC